jgi:serine/threonine protein kinase/tetratricopeptide (TPR) repeat protein
MAEPFSAESSDTASTHDLMADWNAGELDPFEEPPASPQPTGCDAGTGSAQRFDGSAPPAAVDGPSVESMAFVAEFGAGLDDRESTGDLVESLEGGPTRIHMPHPRVANGPAGTTQRKRPPQPSGGSRAGGPQRLPGPGETLGAFRIVRELGRGAFARVYLAEEVQLGRRLVAIKVSRAEGDEPQILARLQHTHIVPVHSVHDDPATGLRVLCMPYFGGANLAQVLDAAGGLIATEHAGRSLVEALDQISRSVPAIASTGTVRRSRALLSADREEAAALCTGSPGSLAGGSIDRSVAVSRFRSFLSRLVGAPYAVPDAAAPGQGLEQHQPSRQFLHGASAVQAAVWIVARLAEGLEHAHARGLLHRDLKPANILLTSDGTPMLLDFNLAAVQLTDSSGGELRRAMVGGTLPYMAPEHLDAFNPGGSTPPESVDERADIYALGLILFEMFAGEHPFPSPAPGTPLLDTIELLTESRRQPPSLRERCPHVPWSLAALVAKCLEFDPARRYARAGDLAEDLRRYLDNLPMKHGPEPSFRERMGKFARRHPGLCSTTSIAVLSLVLLGGLTVAAFVGVEVLRDQNTRFRYKIFGEQLNQTRFLLNTADRSFAHLKRGIEEARTTLGDLGIDERHLGPPRAWSGRLSPAERRAIREQTCELMLVEAQARVALAEKLGTEADRRHAIERAIARLDATLRWVPHVPAALYADRARYHAALGNAGPAARDRQLAAATPPSSGRDWTLLGTARFHQGDRAGAIAALKEAQRLDGSSFWTWFILGHCHYADGDYPRAASDFTVCAVLQPNFAWAHFNRGLAEARAGNLADAKAAYDRALAIERDFTEALLDRALVELELDQLEAAYQDLERARQLGRTDVPVLVALAETLARLGRSEAAEQRFAELLARDPDDPTVRVAHAITLVRTEPARARLEFDRLLGQSPDLAMAHYGMALLCRADDPPRALRHLDRALASNPHLVDALQLRALVRARLGDRAALDDVDRLVKTPTPVRLYNAACAVTLYAEKTSDARLLPHAMELLARAVRAGIPADLAAADPDLKALRAVPAFPRLVAPARRSP